MKSVKIKNVDCYKSAPIEKYGCLLGDLTLKVNYKSDNYESHVILNYSFQFNKEAGQYGQTTFALTNESKDNHVFDNAGNYDQKGIIKILEKRLKSWCKKNQLICENCKGEVELFMAFLDSSYKFYQVTNRETLFKH